MGGACTKDFIFTGTAIGQEIAAEAIEEAIFDGDEDDSDVEWEVNRKYEKDDYLEAQEAGAEGAPGQADPRDAGAGTTPGNPDGAAAPNPENPGKPEDSLELEWIYGFRTFDCHQNVLFNADGDVLFHSAGAVVLLSPQRRTQRFFTGHDDDVLCLAVQDGRAEFGASGQCGKEPKIFVWDARTLEQKACLTGVHEKAVTALAFSPSGETLVSVGYDKFRSLAVWRWRESGAPLATLGSNRHRVFDVQFLPESETRFITLGYRHFFVWEIAGAPGEASRAELRRTVPLWDRAVPRSPLSAAVYGGDVYTGHMSGEIYRWKGNRCLGPVPVAHTGCVFGLAATPSGIVSAGKDGRVHFFDPASPAAPASTLDVAALLREMKGVTGLPLSIGMAAVKTVDCKRGKLLLGLRGSEVLLVDYEAALADGAGAKGNVNWARFTSIVVQGHAAAKKWHGHEDRDYQGELWGLAAHPSLELFATAGDDATVRLWDAAQHAPLALKAIASPASTVAFSPDGSSLAVGCFDGGVVVLDLEMRERARFKATADQEIFQVRYSPDGRWLAVASLEQTVAIFEAAKDYARVGTCSGHESYVLQLDWSEDGKLLQTMDGVYSRRFWRIPSCVPADEAAGQAAEWASWTLTAGPPVDEIADTVPPPASVTCADRSHCARLLATGDTAHGVRLFSFPGAAANPGFREFRAHSEPVTNVRWSADDRRLYSVGRSDLTVAQWRRKFPGPDPRLLAPALPSGPAAAAAAAALHEADREEEAHEGGPEDSDVEAELAQAYLPAPQRLKRRRRAEAGGAAGDADDYEVDEGQGEQAGAVAAPWLGASHAPSNWRQPAAAPPAPSDALAVEWVHGYRGFDTRHNVAYVRAPGQAPAAAFHAAALCVVHDAAAHAQRHYTGHDDDVLCLAVHPSGRVAASGQVGPRNQLHVWDAETMQQRAVVKDAHQRGCCSVAWSSDGKLLVSVGLDDANTIAVWHWDGRQLRKAASGRGGSQRVLTAQFRPNSHEVVSVGVKHFATWAMQGAVLVPKKGVFGRRAKLQPLLALAFCEAGAVTGANDGDLYVWRDGTVAHVAAKAHAGPAFALHCEGGLLVSGGKDGRVRLWGVRGGALEATRTIDVAKAAASLVDAFGRALAASFGGAGQPVVRSVARSAEGALLVGLKQGALLEVAEDGTARVLVQGHAPSNAYAGKQADYQGELWGLATHPKAGEYATAGEDKTLRVWDLAARRLKSVRALPDAARRVCYSPDGARLAVGLASGSVLVIDGATLRDVATIASKQRTGGVRDVAFSPDGRRLAVAASEAAVDVYDATGDFKQRLHEMTQGISGAVTKLDWSADSRYLQGVTTGYELLFWDAERGERVTATAGLRDVQWATWTLPVGWPVQGVHASTDRSDVNAVARSHEGDLIATGDDGRKVRLFPYPCPYPRAASKAYSGHSEHVTNVRWSFDDRHLVSTGGADLAVIQWRHAFTDGDPADDPAALPPEYDSDAAKDVAGRLKKSKGAAKAAARAKRAAPAAAAAGPGEFEVDEGRGEEAGASRAWMGTALATVPDNWVPRKDPKARPAKESLALEAAFGYRGYDCRANVFPLGGEEVLYHTAALAVALSGKTKAQRFFQGHSDDVVSMAVAPDGETVATGQLGKRGTLLVWNARTLAVQADLSGFHGHDVVALAFSGDGRRLASVGGDDAHTLALWELRPAPPAGPARPLASCRGDPGAVLFAAYAPGADTVYLGGHKLLKAFALAGGQLSSRRMAAPGTGNNTYTSAAFCGAEMWTGTATGSILVWVGTELAATISAHNGPCFAVASGHAPGSMVSGGKDGKLCVFQDKGVVRRIDLCAITASIVDEFGRPRAYMSGAAPCVRAIGVRGEGGGEGGRTFLVGTKAGEIYEIAESGGKVRVLVQGHAPSGDATKRAGGSDYDGEVWGLATHPTDASRFVTGGDDKTLRMWDLRERRLVSWRMLPDAVRSVAISPDGLQVAAGTLHGTVMVLDLDGGWREVFNKANRTGEITDVKFSPSGNFLAAASRDRAIDVYHARQGFKRIAICKGHAAAVTHIDWDADSQYLQSQDASPELLFWDALTGLQITNPKSMKGARWATQTCTVGWSVAGLLPPGATTDDVNACTVPSGPAARTVVASGDDLGKVNLLAWPCTEEGAAALQYVGHASHVTNVRFTCDNRHLISTGGADLSVLVWRVAGLPAASGGA